MAQSQPHHLISGLQGGYIPNILEHYETKTAARDALRDLMERIDHDGTMKTRGSLREGFYLFSWSDIVNGFHEYAEILPCENPRDCEAINDEEWSYA